MHVPFPSDADAAAGLDDCAELGVETLVWSLEPEEFGTLCAFVCGARSGYITGQNLLIDGGAYPGTL